MGIELYPKFLSLAGTRCYHPCHKPIVAKCCQRRMRARSLVQESSFANLFRSNTSYFDARHFLLEPSKTWESKSIVFFQAVSDKNLRKRSVCSGDPLQVSTQACGFPEQTRQIDKQKCQSGKIDERQPMHSVGGGLHLSFCVSGNLRVAKSTNAFLPTCIWSNCPQTGDRFE